jgi:hypothetical protein
VNLGKIKSFPNINISNNISKHIDILSKNNDYEYEVSLLGKKVVDKEHINLNTYGNLYIKFVKNFK